MMTSSFMRSALILVAATSFALGQQVLDGLAAVVNGDAITISQVRELVAAQERALRTQLSGKELEDKIRAVRLAALDDLIERQLILQEFKTKKFNLPDYVVEDRVQQIVRQEFNGDRQAFSRTLEAQGYSLAKFREIEREKIIVQAMRSQAVRQPPSVAPAQIEAAYRENRAAYTTPDQMKLRMLMLKTAAAKKAMANEILGKIKEGASFEQMAQMYSEDSAQDVGGDWGWIDRKTLADKLSDTAFKLKPGETSGIIELENNLYLLHSEGRKFASVRPLSEVRDEIRRKLEAEERLKAEKKWLAGLRSKAYVKTF
jgi:parvulin-like peptidyl-prolyl isomerase